MNLDLRPTKLLSSLLVGALLSSSVASGRHQQPLPWQNTQQSPGRVSKIITPDFRAWVDGLLEQDFVGGYSIAIVRPHSSIPEEFGNWGNSTEDGEGMTPDVSVTYGTCSQSSPEYCLDTFYTCLSFKGLCSILSGHPYGRLRPWAKQNTPTRRRRRVFVDHKNE